MFHSPRSLLWQHPQSLISFLITHHAAHWKLGLFPGEGGYSSGLPFLPGLRALVRFSESTGHWICFCCRTQEYVQGSGHSVGAGAGFTPGWWGDGVGCSRGLWTDFLRKSGRSAGTVFLECALMFSSASFPFLFLPSVMKCGLRAGYVTVSKTRCFLVMSLL